MSSRFIRAITQLLPGVPSTGSARIFAAQLARSTWVVVVSFGALVPLAEAASGAPAVGSADLSTPQSASMSSSIPPDASSAPARAVRLAEFGQIVPSSEVQKLAHWIVDSANNANLPFMIVDKVGAQVLVFTPQGQLKDASSALLGLAIGDDSVPGIGDRKLSTIRPEERTTPAGRFVASLDRDIHGKELLWVDYETAVSLHKVVTGSPKERRAERLASPSPLDNRISYGCINVPAKFYDSVVSPSFTGTSGIVYILPETRSAREVFGSYDVQDAARGQVAARGLPASNSTSR